MFVQFRTEITLLHHCIQEQCLAEGEFCYSGSCCDGLTCCHFHVGDMLWDACCQEQVNKQKSRLLSLLPRWWMIRRSRWMSKRSRGMNRKSRFMSRSSLMGRMRMRMLMSKGEYGCTTQVAATLIQAALAGSSTQYPSTHPPEACNNHVCQEEGLFPEVAANIWHFACFTIED